MSASTQFTKLQYESKQPVAGFDMWVAIWTNNGMGDTVIGAPSLDGLEKRWEEITLTKLERARAQHVIAIRFNAPEELFEQAKAIARGANQPK